MDLFRLQAIRNDLRIDRLTIFCTGEMDVDWRSLRELQFTDDGRSLKRTDDTKILKLAESLLRFGIINNLQVWVDESAAEIYCFDAHHRQKALRLLEEIGLEVPSLPATRCLAKSIIEAKKLLLLKESRSSWVDLAVVPDYLKNIGFDFNVASAVIDLPEFTWGELDSGETEDDAEARSGDKSGMSNEDARVDEGSLVELGRHRLLCGDARDSSDVDRLLGGYSWDCLVFDPPYELEELYETIPIYQEGRKMVVFWDFKRFAIASASALRKGWTAQYEFIWDNITSWYTPNRPSSRHKACGVFCDDPFFDTDKGIIKDGKERKSKVVTNTRGSCDYTPLNGAKHISTVEQFPNFSEEDGSHSHAKPLLWLGAIYNGLGCDMFLDLFGGSGSTLIYAEQNHKTSFTMELEPKHCHEIIQRWVDFTKNFEIKIDGKTQDWRDLCG